MYVQLIFKTCARCVLNPDFFRSQSLSLSFALQCSTLASAQTYATFGCLVASVALQGAEIGRTVVSVRAYLWDLRRQDDAKEPFEEIGESHYETIRTNEYSRILSFEHLKSGVYHFDFGSFASEFGSFTFAATSGFPHVANLARFIVNVKCTTESANEWVWEQQQ